jgi:hypothetical protein
MENFRHVPTLEYISLMDWMDWAKVPLGEVLPRITTYSLARSTSDIYRNLYRYMWFFKVGWLVAMTQPFVFSLSQLLSSTPSCPTNKLDAL